MTSRDPRRPRCCSVHPPIPVAVVAGLLSLGCAAPAPVLRQPGSIAAARFGPGEASPRFRVLAQLTQEIEEPAKVTVAENARELGALWSGYDLPGAAPQLDFERELAIAFTENGFCNDGALEGFGLTTAGELIPVVRNSGLVCPLVSYGDCPQVRVYVAALDRQAFPAGPYRLRGPTPVPFVVHAGAPAGPIPPSTTVAAPPPADDGDAGRHPRHARVVDRAGATEAGAWVRADAVWIPYRAVTRVAVEPPAPALICDGAACVRVVARVGCWAPECPAEGLLLFGERPMGPRDPWPTDAASWERLMNELAQDPALSKALPQPARYPPPPPEQSPRVGWAAHRFNRSTEISASAEYRRPFGGASALLGPTLRVGLRGNEAVRDTTTQGKVLEPLVGDGWGADLRLGVLRELGDGGPSPRTAWRIGLGLAAANAVGPSTSESRVRVQSVLALLVPELGLFGVSGEPLRFSLANAFPVSFLLSARVALELRPELALMFGSGRREEMLSVSVGLMWRTRRAICPNPRPAPDVGSAPASAEELAMPIPTRPGGLAARLDSSCRP